MNLRYEIVVVDDGSKDKTLSKAIAYANRNGHVKVVSYNKNVGKGYAVKAGFMQATGEVVVFADSDMEIDLSMFQVMLRLCNMEISLSQPNGIPILWWICL